MSLSRWGRDPLHGDPWSVVLLRLSDDSLGVMLNGTCGAIGEVVGGNARQYQISSMAWMIELIELERKMRGIDDGSSSCGDAER